MMNVEEFHDLQRTQGEHLQKLVHLREDVETLNDEVYYLREQNLKLEKSIDLWSKECRSIRDQNFSFRIALDDLKEHLNNVAKTMFELSNRCNKIVKQQENVPPVTPQS